MVIKRWSVLAIPIMVLIKMGNTAAKTVMMIFEIAPRPNIIMISGKSAISGVA